MLCMPPSLTCQRACQTHSHLGANSRIAAPGCCAAPEMIARRLQPGEKLWGADSRTPYRAVGLVALLATGYVLHSILWPLRWSLLSAWVVIECIYYVFYFKPRFAALEEQPELHRPADCNAERGMAMFRRFLRFCKELPRGVDYEQYYSGWFRGASFESIKRGNAEEFMAYGFFYRSMEEMSADPTLRDLPGQMVRELEATWGVRFQDGHTPGLRFMGHLWEPLRATYRPLAFYLGTEGVGRLARLLLRRWGFKQGTMDGLAYFTLNLTDRPSLMGGHSTATPPAAGSSAATTAAAASSSASKAAGAAGAGAATGAVTPPLPGASASAPAAAGGGGEGGASDGAAPGLQKNISLVRSKSSPFEAGPPDWAALLGQPDPAAAAAAAAGAGPAPGLASSSSSSDAGMVTPPTFSQMLLSTMSTRANPLQGALSEQLGSRDTPVLFLHGVGGLPAYLEMISHVMGLGHPVIVVEFRGVSMRWGKVYTADEVVASIIKILDHLGVKEVCLVGHSYGTFIAGALARHHKSRVHNVCVIDPVCFGMFMPHLLYNFLYRRPVWDGRLVHYLKESVRVIACGDMHVAATFSRSFYWSELNLWPEDLPRGCLVMLSGRDDLMNSMEVKDMLEVAGGIKVMYNHELTHGAFLFNAEVKATIVQEVRTMLARSGSAVVHVARPLLERTLTMARTALAPALALAPQLNLRKGSSGRQYVEDHTNRLVRTFTGNLAAMMSFTTTPSNGGPASPRTHRTVSADSPTLLQTFSGPIRRRFKGHWGSASIGGAPASTKASPVAPMVPKVSSGGGGAAGSKAGRGAGGLVSRRSAHSYSSGGGGASKEPTMAGIGEDAAEEVEKSL